MKRFSSSQRTRGPKKYFGNNNEIKSSLTGYIKNRSMSVMSQRKIKNKDLN